MNTELIMIGTGSAFPKHSYNSCFAIRSESFLLLVDAGGGNGIFAALQKSGIGSWAGSRKNTQPPSWWAVWPSPPT